MWLTFASAYLIVTLSPGPNVLLVIRNSLKYGSSSALVTISGNLASQLVVVLLVAWGVGAALTVLPEFFWVMKIIGALYLMWLGIQQIRATYKSTSTISKAQSDNSTMSSLGIFRQAFLVSGSNPKTLIFLSAFMPQFIDSTNPLAGQFVIMYLTIATIVACVHIFYSILANQLKQKIKHSRFVSTLKYFGGTIFVLLGLKLLISERT
jgi:threonine/homoserine/homoserine lactone efflux protein